MVAQPDDPFAAMRWRSRLGLRRRLKRAWREGLAQQHTDALSRLRRDLIGLPVASTDYHGTIGEITFGDGTVLRLWLCHRPALKTLCAAAAEGDVRLVQADHHSHCWALYFLTLEGRLPLMCRELRVRHAQGGIGAPLDPAVPMPDGYQPRV